MDGYTPLVLNDEPMVTPAITETKAEWVAVRVGDSVMFVWFGREG
ncbi:MAG: hypothetical protein ACT6Q8_17830 [Niveispirillum sp.]